ncbi:diaminopimelate decarboxylase [Rickettsiales bacterium]|nr:diaminopimelate decarboxylase [Rickettsiales bacterium]
MEDFITQKNRVLHIENLAIDKIATKIPTPFYCYSQSLLEKNFNNFTKNFSFIDHKICYAIKANSNINLVKILAKKNSGIDAVSAGEIFRAIKGGINPKKIVFAGVGKSKEEIEFALKNNVEEFSIESKSELYLLSKVAQDLNKIAKIAIRVNPNIDANTHDKISTGRKGDKFGIDIDEALDIYKIAQNLPNITIFGIATHIGSQITSLEPFKKAFKKIRELYFDLQKENITIKNFDLGGGIGICYDDEKTINLADYANIIKDITKDLDVSLTLAPGRAIIGNAGILISKIIHIKKTSYKNFLIIDAAMNDLARPSLYDSYHRIIPVKTKIGELQKYEIVGGICETSDVFGKGREFNDPKSDELIAILDAGAYGASMSNEYNSRNLIPEILVKDQDFRIIRRRPSFDEMIRLEESLK